MSRLLSTVAGTYDETVVAPVSALVHPIHEVFSNAEVLSSRIHRVTEAAASFVRFFLGHLSAPFREVHALLVARQLSQACAVSGDSRRAFLGILGSRATGQGQQKKPSHPRQFHRRSTLPLLLSRASGAAEGGVR